MLQRLNFVRILQPPTATMHCWDVLLVVGLVASAARANQLSKRVPRFDIFLYEESGCKEKVGEMCEEREVNTCCHSNDNTLVWASANYAEPGSTKTSDIAEIGAYDMRTVDGKVEHCFSQQTKDGKCATGQWPMFGGAQVFAGSDTPTRKRRGEGQLDATTTKIFYQKGFLRWTINVNSNEAAEYYRKDKADRQAYMMMVGELKVLS
jgi:hypothetical protein